MRPLACLILAGAALVAKPAPADLPKPEHGLDYDTPAKVWDEAIPLGNSALVWGDGKPLRISPDRTNLWDLRRVPEFWSSEYGFAQMRRWHEEGPVKDLLRIYEDPCRRVAPTKIPAGHIQLTFGSAEFRRTGLSLADAVATVGFRDGSDVRLIVHATQPVGMAFMRGATPAGTRLAPPPVLGHGGRDGGGPAKPSPVARQSRAGGDERPDMARLPRAGPAG